MTLRIAQMSDGHAECRKDRSKFIRKLKSWIKDARPDVMVFAGDMDSAISLPSFLTEVLPWPKEDWQVPYAIFVTGSHEYYHTLRSIDDINKELSEHYDGKEFGETKFAFLDDSSYTIEKDGVSYRFSGGTLWTDLNLFNDPVMSSRYAQQGLNDYRYIVGKNGFNALAPAETVERHEKTITYLESVLSSSTGEADVDIVVTHHQPTLKTCLPKYREDNCTPCFASNLDQFIKDHDIALWMAGHSHGARSVFMNNTFISNNTLGYPGEQKTQGIRVMELDYDKGTRETLLSLV